MRILAIESSCDDLSICLYEDKKVVSLAFSSQEEVHRKYGGVIPELASREHLKMLIPTLESCLEKANASLDSIEAIAATFAPGLIGSILVGLNFAKTLALCLNIPFIGIHHIEAHLLSPQIEHECLFPALGLVVSGGHTHLYKIKKLGEYELMSQTVDDAVGEAFDKVAKVIGLPYPGGPEIDKLAKEGNPNSFSFTFPRVKSNTLFTSFSGIKTACLQYWEQSTQNHTIQKDIAASFQSMVVRILMKTLKKASQLSDIKTLLLSGGVACNSELRNAVRSLEKEGWNCFLPSPKYCTDNAAMIANLAYQYLEQNKNSPINLDAHAQFPLETISY